MMEGSLAALGLVLVTVCACSDGETVIGARDGSIDADDVTGRDGESDGTERDEAGVDDSDEVDGGPDADPDADADVDADADADVDGDSADGTDGEVPDECAGQPNFTPCTVVTSPDRSYDICIDGVCVSPGCGDETCNAPGPNWTLADTGQRDCYDDSTTVSCSALGTPGTPACEATAFCGQDAQYGWDVTHTAAERFTRSVPVASQPVVHDNVTGLDWQGCAYGMTGDTASCTGTASRRLWRFALADCDELSWAGFTDWRLPDEFELQSIVDYGQGSSPTIDRAAFPATPDGYFWSSSVQAGPDSASSWLVYFRNGDVDANDWSDGAHVRCVRGGSHVPVPRFTRTVTAGYPVVEDAATGLVWQGCPAGMTGDAVSCSGTTSVINWQAALDYCRDSTAAGFSDWYLPSVDELRSIVDNHRGRPSIDTTSFPETPPNYFWSSSSDAGSASDAWSVGFFDGHVYSTSKATTFPLRCVRREP